MYQVETDVDLVRLRLALHASRAWENPRSRRVCFASAVAIRRTRPGLAVGITVGQQQLSPTHVLWRFLLAYAGGTAAGLLTAWLSVRVRWLLDDPLLENMVSLLTPFTAFLLAELVHASGVLAVVVAGIALSQVAATRIIRADTRQQSFAFWRLSTFALNAALFVLVGLQLPRVVQNLTTMHIPRALAVVGIISAVVIGVRFAWLFAARHLGRLVDGSLGSSPVS